MQRFACASSIALTTRAATVTLSAYPGYTGSLAVKGSVTLSAVGDNLMLDWAISGLEAEACAGAPPAGVANACGIHIHEGMGCESAAQVGGHYFDSGFEIDPWANVCYNALEGESKGSSAVTIGKSFDSIKGRAFVVHDSTGGRVGCGEISAEQMQLLLRPATVTLSAYPGYTGSLAVTGSVTLSAVGDNLMLDWAISGLEANACAGAPPAGVANACGIHIHEGMGCESATQVGGHYFDSGFEIDPWANVCYNALEGESKGSSAVTIGKSFDSIKGRAFVVHDSTGGRVGCGEISAEQMQLLLDQTHATLI